MASDLVDRILAGAGQLDLGGLVGEQVKPASVGKQSDRYMSSQAILDVVAATWPDGIDLDPCADEESLVIAKEGYNIRRGEDGLTLPWHGRVWLNPPYSSPEPWLARAAQHAADGVGEVLCLVNASVGTKAWQRWVFPFASICCLNPRPKFRRAGCSSWTYNTKDSSILYFGPHREHFMATWAPHGELVSSVRLLPVPPTLSLRPLPEKHDQLVGDLPPVARPC